MQWILMTFLLNPIDILNDNPKILAKYKKMFKYILVDEIPGY